MIEEEADQVTDIYEIKKTIVQMKGAKSSRRNNRRVYSSQQADLRSYRGQEEPKWPHNIRINNSQREPNYKLHSRNEEPK